MIKNMMKLKKNIFYFSEIVLFKFFCLKKHSFLF